MDDRDDKEPDKKKKEAHRAALITCGYPDKKYRVKSIFTHEQVLSLKKLGTTVDVYDSFADFHLFHDFREDCFENVTVYRMPSIFWFKHPYKLMSSLFAFRHLAQKKGYEYVILNFLDIRHLPFVFILPRKVRIGVITHGTDAMALWENRITRSIKKYILKKATHIFPVSDQTKSLIETILPPEQYTKIHLNYNGINKEKLDHTKHRSKDEMKKEKGISASQVILTVCDLVPRKGISINLLADRLILREGIDFVHIIIGKGPEKENLHRLAQDLGLSENIIWIEYIESDTDLAEYYAIADIYTMISKTIYNPLGMEGFGISYIEAEYLGVPVVGGNSGGVSTAVKHGFTGFLVDPTSKNPECAVAQYILRLIKEPELYREMSRNAQRYVSENFDWEKNAMLLNSAILDDI